MNYMTNFFANVGGSAVERRPDPVLRQHHARAARRAPGSRWRSTSRTPQACSAASGSTRSPAPATIVTTGLAENLTNDPIAAEAVKAEQHFGYDIDATYFVFTPPGHAATAYGTVYCAYHSEVTNIGGHGIRYAFMPYTPEQGAGCGGNSVNKKNDAFGHGYLDSYSLAGGHEYAEAVTDPDTFPTPGRLERLPDQRERRQVRLLPRREHPPGHAVLRRPADVEQRGQRRRRRLRDVPRHGHLPGAVAGAVSR